MEDLEIIIIDKEKLKKRIDEYYPYDEERITNIARQIDISYNFSIDYCNKDSSLIYFVWLYYRWLRAQYKKFYLQKSSDPIILKVIANYNWLKDTFKFINSTIDRKLNEQEIIILAKFVSFFKYFQSAEGCIAICKTIVSPDLLEATNGRRLKKEYAIGSFFTLEQLKQVLITDIIQDNRFIFIKSPLHTTALFKEEGNYYYLNASGNETQTTSIDKIALLVFQDHPDSSVGLEIFSLDEKHKEYPYAKDILKKINPALFTKGNHPKISGIEVAAKIGSLDSIEYFLEENCYAGIQLFMALTLASKYGHYKIVKALLENGSIDVNKQNRDRDTPLVLASTHGHSEIVKLLLARDDIDVNATDGLLGLPPLAWASGNNNIGVVELLLKDERINVNDFGMQQFGEFNIKFTERIQTPLLISAQLGYLEIIKLLLAHKNIDPNLQNDEGCAPLMKAAEYGRVEVIKILLESKDIDPNIKDKKNETAFLKALKSCHFEIARLLLSHPKTDPSITGKYQWVNFTPPIIPKIKTVSPLCNERNLWFYKKTKKNNTKKIVIAIKNPTKNQPSITLIKQKINQYLNSSNKDKKFNSFFAEDYFSSVSLSWLYVKWLRLQSELFERDYNWVESAIKLISNWESNKNFTKTDIAKIENFILLMQDIQCIKKELLVVWQKNDQYSKKQDFEIKHYLLFTLEQVKKILEKGSIIQNNKIVFLGFNNHATAIFKNDKYYYLFNLNNQILETRVLSIEELVQLIFIEFKDGPSNAKPIYFSTLSFDVGILEYFGALVAAKAGSLESGQYFLNRGKTVADYGAIILEKAIYHGHVDVVKALLAHPNNVDPNTLDKQGITALMQAVQREHLEVVKELLAHADINLNIQDKYGTTALMRAVITGNLGIVKILLAHKNINLNIQDIFGKTALILACLPEQYDIFIRSLSDSTIDFTSVGFTDFKNKYNAEKNNFTFNLSAHENRLNIIKTLLDQPEINPNICDNNGYYALQSTIASDNIEFIKTLLERRSHFDLNRNSYDIALILAAQNGCFEIVSILLVQPNINPNATNIYGSTALIEASKNGHFAIVKKLLAHPNIDPNIQIKADYNWTAIIYAAKYKYPEIVGALLAHPKIDTKIRDTNGKTVFELINYFLNTPDQDSIDKATDNTLEQKLLKEIYREPNQYLKLDSEQWLNNGNSFMNPTLLKVIENKELKKEYAIGSLFTLEQLIQVLEILEIMQSGKLVTITSYKKTVVLFKNGTEYYLANAKDKNAAHIIISIEDLAKLIFATNSYEFTKPSPLGIEIFSLDCKFNTEYIASREILKKINPFLVTERGYANGCSGLQIAAVVNSLESVQYFLEKRISPRVKDDDNITALIIASMYGYIDIVKELLSSKNNGSNIDYNISDKEKKEIALTLACKNNHIEVVQELLMPRSYTTPLIFCNENAFLIALKRHYFKITNLLLERCTLIDSVKKIDYIGNAFINPFIHDHLEVVTALRQKDSLMLYGDSVSNIYKNIDTAKNNPTQKPIVDNDKILINNSIALLEKLKCHLKYNGKNQNFIDYFDECYCNAIPLLWIYIKYLQLNTNQKDECEWFISIIKLINNWDVTKKLEEQEIIEVEKLTSLILEINNVRSYLLPICQEKSKQEFKNLKYNEGYYVLSTESQLKKILETGNITQGNKLIFVESGGDITSVLKHGNSYLYFSPNSSASEVKASSIEELAKIIFENRHSNQSGNQSSSPVVFCLFSFDITAFAYLGLMLSAKLGNLHHNHSFLNTEILRKAAYHGHVDLVKLLLIYPDIDPNIQDEYGYTPLMWAVERGQLDVVKELLAHKSISPNIRSKNGLSALALAFMFEELGVVEVFIKDKNFDPANTDTTAYKKAKSSITIDIAKQKRQLDIIKALITHPGIDTQITDKKNWNTLSWITSYDSYEIVNEILKNPTNCLNLRGEQGLNLLTEAVKNNCLEVVRALLPQINIDPYMKKEFSTALVEAAGNGYVEIVKMLLAHPNIDPNMNYHGSIALVRAASNNHTKIVKLLLSHTNIDPNKKNIINNAALIMASIHGNIEVVKVLLSHPKIDVNIKGKGDNYSTSGEDNWPAVVHAAKKGHRDIVDLLLRYPSVDTNMRTEQGLTVAELIEQFLQEHKK